MKKLNNKGFSLVELIIVIAIMAILAAALAPQLIKYIEKSRISSDKTSAASVKTAFDTAIANDQAYDDALTGKRVECTDSTDLTFDGTDTVLTSEMAKTLSDLKPAKSKKYKGQQYWVSWEVDEKGDGIGSIEFGLGADSSEDIK